MTSFLEEPVRVNRSAFWFGPENKPLFGWLHAPENGACRGTVIFCQPIGQEYKHAHFVFRTLADRLAERGFATLRYDHPGTGDSAGEPKPEGWVAEWAAGLSEAVNLARKSAAAQVSIIGMRLGATLAAAEVLRLGPIDGLVLWDPSASGRSFMRQQRLLAAAASAQPFPPEEVDGFTQGPAFLLPVELTHALPWPWQPPANVRRVLVIEAAKRRRIPGLDEWLGQTPADFVEAKGLDELLEGKELEAVLPEANISAIVRWIDELSPHETSLLRPPAPRKVRVVFESSRKVTEEIAEFGNGLFGIRTYPTGGAPTPTVIFSNEAYHHHIGPGRLWVDLARRLATLGLASLRFDLSGLGDSQARNGEHELRVRSAVAFDDYVDAINLVSPSDPRQVVLVGLCSSAYQSLESALEQHVRAVCAINPIVDFVPPEVEDGNVISARRKFCLPHNSLVSAARQSRFLLAIKDRHPNLAWRFRHLAFTRNLPRFDFASSSMRASILC